MANGFSDSKLMVWRNPVPFGTVILRSSAPICTGESTRVVSETGSKTISSAAEPERVSIAVAYFQPAGIRSEAWYWMASLGAPPG